MKFIFAFILLNWSILANCQSISNKWEFQNISGTILKFKNGNAYDTHLYNLKYVGQIPNGDKAPFLIFSGTDCDECDENISIYIQSPANGKLAVENGANRYQYPGKQKDYETNNLVYEGRAFYGQVLKNTFGVIWYEKNLSDKGKWYNSIFLAKIKNGREKDVELKDTHQLNETLSLLKQRLCTEIKGMSYATEP